MNPSIQFLKKRQEPARRPECRSVLEVWCLKLLWSLKLEVWSLALRPPSSFRQCSSFLRDFAHFCSRYFSSNILHPSLSGGTRCRHQRGAPGDANGPRGRPGSHRSRSQKDVQISSAAPLHVDALRAGTASRSVGGIKMHPPLSIPQLLTGSAAVFWRRLYIAFNHE